jgi:CheY-like chemotaxis protein
MRLLLVEDELVAGQLLAKGLRDSAYAVDVVADGQTAIARVGVNDYDLIILDLGLPDIDGIAVCQSLRDQDIHAPALMLSARDANDVELQSFALSLTTTLAASPGQSGAIAVTLGEPTIKAQVVKQSPNEDTTGEQLEGIVDGAWGLVGNMMGDTLGAMPMPAIAGMQIGAPALKGEQGFLVVDVPVQ